MKKGEMAEAAEGLVAGKGWLPSLLRAAPQTPVEADEGGPLDGGDAGPPDRDDYAFAAE